MNPALLRAESQRRFATWGLAFNEHLPLLEAEGDLHPKPPEVVASRAVAAGYVAAASFGAPADKVTAELRRLQLWQVLSSEERAFLEGNADDPNATAFHGWLVESIQCMAWALDLAQLDHFAPCETDLAARFPQAGTDPTPFIAQARLRPLTDLRQEADTLYMLHWLAVELQLTGEQNERLVLPRIAFRRHAADWLIGVAEKWEDVSLDT